MKFARILSILAFSAVFAMLFSSVTNVTPLAFFAPLVGVGAAQLMGYIQLPAGVLMLNFGAITTMAFPDLDGREAMGGYGSIVYLAFVKDIAEFPTQPNIETITAVADAAKLSGNFTMEASKYFYPVRLKPRSLSFTPEGQGETSGKSFKIKGSFFIPGLDAESMGLARAMNNRYCILIVPDPSGAYRICIGTKEMPAEISATGAGGQNPTDAKGFTFNFEADSFAPGWIYNGTIALSGTSEPAIS